MNVYEVNPNHAHHLISVITPYINKVIKHSQKELSLSDYILNIISGEMVLWVIEDNGIVGVYVTYANGETLLIVAHSCDDFSKYYSSFYTIEDYAKTHGFKNIKFLGRQGWVKTLKKYIPGFYEEAVVMRIKGE